MKDNTFSLLCPKLCDIESGGPVCLCQVSEEVPPVFCKSFIQQFSSLSIWAGCGLCSYSCAVLSLSLLSGQACSFFLSVSAKRKCVNDCFDWQAVWVAHMRQCVCICMQHMWEMSGQQCALSLSSTCPCQLVKKSSTHTTHGRLVIVVFFFLDDQ